ncbi:MAG: SAM-dependent DNA methyltransferase, partial [Ignavibacteriae bacterium]
MAEKKKTNGDNLDFEDKLWRAADKMRNNIDAAEYKHVVLGLIFLKYISDSFEELHTKLLEKVSEGYDPEDPDEYRAENVFWVPPESRWTYLLKNAKQPTIGTLIDDAMDGIERDNTELQGVLPKNYAREQIDKQRLGELIDLIGTIGLGDAESRKKDILGKVYEYFIGQFADAEGKRGGQFYTAKCIVKLIVEMIKPLKGRIYDPCCGSGGMFVQSEKFVESHGGRIGDVSIYGQESNQTTWRLAKMNLAIRGIDANIAWANSFTDDKFPDLKADFIMANPPFNDSDWQGELLRDDVRWKFGVPPVGNANFAWVQHFIHHLNRNGYAAFVLSNSSLSATNTGDSPIRKRLIDDNLVDCIITLPSNLFYNTAIGVSIWVITRNKQKTEQLRDRTNELLLIDARKLGTMIDLNHRVLTSEDINKIIHQYHKWRRINGDYENIVGFSKSVLNDEIKKNGYNLSPNKYIEKIIYTSDKVRDEQKLIELAKKIYKYNERRTVLQEILQEKFSKLCYNELSLLPFGNLDIRTLYILSDLLFKKWFINFDFPDKQGKPYIANGGRT